MSVVTEALQRIDWKNKHVLVACSGGVDSMVLLHALVKTGLRPEVLHVNYQLRGTDSDADQQLVEATAAGFGLKTHVHSCDPATLQRTGTNLQGEAREFRRRFFSEWTERSKEHVVVLAHHADDQLETFFLQWLRGSGTFGLGGMHPERNRIVRPFLHLPKSALLQFAEEQKIAWREDASNAQSAYARNLFRNEWLPALSHTNPDLKESVLLIMELFRGRQQELRDSIDPVIASWNHSEIRVPQWQQLSQEQKLAFVHVTGIPVWTIARFDQLCEGKTGTKFLTGGLTIWKSTDALIRIVGKNSAVSEWDFKIEEVGILPVVFDKEAIYLDGAKLSGSLRLRSSQTGDRIKSVGVNGSQLVSDVLKDAGIPRSERANIQLLTDDREILWIPGIKVGRTAIAHADSSVILKVTLDTIDDFTT